MRKPVVVAVAAALTVMGSGSASAFVVIEGAESSGLSAEARFDILNPTTLQIILTNTSTGTPGGFGASDQLLTAVAFDLPGSTAIVGGSAVINAGSVSVNFDKIASQLSGGDDVSVEWGYNNNTSTGLAPLTNMVAALNNTGVTQFTTATSANNLDGPVGIAGPQGGLTNGLVPIGGQGGIQNSIIVTANLSASVVDLSFLDDGVRFEFGSDAAFLDGGQTAPIPEPATMALFGIGLAGLAGLGVLGWHRRRRRDPGESAA